jgi:hypothetical protein
MDDGVVYGPQGDFGFPPGSKRRGVLARMVGGRRRTREKTGKKGRETATRVGCSLDRHSACSL